MPPLQRALQARSFQTSSLVLILFSLVCTRIPMLNYLGFEFSVFTVILAGYVSGILTLAFWKHAVSETTSDVWRFIGKSFLIQLVLLLIPLLVSVANAVFVKNCSLGNGLTLYMLTVVPGVFFCSMVAMCVGVVVDRWRKSIFSIAYILILLHIPVVTFFQPQIFTFNPILGFFPGFTYDESLQVTQRLFTFRLETLAVTGLIAAASVWIWQIRRNHNQRAEETEHSLPVLEWAVLALLGPIVLVILLNSDRLGLSSSEEFVRQKLAGHIQTEHFEIIYPAGALKRERIDQISRLHEFYFELLSKEMNLHSRERIYSFIYASPEQKGRLIGAARTDISKPWLRQIHINLSDIEFALKHEMTHVIASEFGWSPMKIAQNSGLIEGLAVAMERSSVEERLDRAAALAFASGAHSNLESLFTRTGFFQANAGVSYTLAGAFCRSLIDSFGIDRFKRVYASNDFHEIYQTDLNSLLTRWQTSVKSIPLTLGDSVKAEYCFRRPSIFGKECARIIANINSETREFFFQHEFDKALASSERSLALSETPEAVSQKTSALFELHRYQDVVVFTREQLRDEKLRFALLPLGLRLGDALWALDSLDQAWHVYETLADVHLGSWYEEACALRQEVLRSSDERRTLQFYFIYKMEDTERVSRLEQLRTPVSRYLLASEYAGKDRFAESARILDSLGSMRSATLEYFRLRRLGKVLFDLQDYGKAKIRFEQSLTLAPTSYLKTETEEWLERCMRELSH